MVRFKYKLPYQEIQIYLRNLGHRIIMNKEFACSIKSIRFDENYHPSDSTRLTTNFANLARGENRQENLRKTLAMINNRFNDLAHWDNPQADRYSVEVEIISADMDIEGKGKAFPVIEIGRASCRERV